MTSKSIREFESFFRGWLVRQEHFLDELRSALLLLLSQNDNNNNNNNNSNNNNNNNNMSDLVTRVLAHYQQYYEEKSRIANHDVSLVFSPPWFSCFEKSFLWIAGFKPGLAFRVAIESVDDLDEQQMERINHLQTDTKNEERELENKMARIQESVAGEPIVEVVRTRRSDSESLLVDGKLGELESAIDVLRSEMEVVLGNADVLRTRTAEKLLQVLTPCQNIKFLAAVTELQLKIRMFGWQIDAQKY